MPTVLTAADLTDDVNLVTIYVYGGNVPADMAIVPIGLKAPPVVPRTWRKTQQRLVEYTKKNMVYTYDVATDGQRHVIHRVLGERPAATGRYSYHVILGAEDVLPTHRFPCTRQMHDVAYIQRDVYKVHHRVSFIVDRCAADVDGLASAPYVSYFKYTHGPQVDVPQVLDVIHRALEHIKV